MGKSPLPIGSSLPIPTKDSYSSLLSIATREDCPQCRPAPEIKGIH
jgi:hypothetical protein